MPNDSDDSQPDRKVDLPSVSVFQIAKLQLARSLRIRRRQQRPWFGRAVDNSGVMGVQNTPTGGSRRRCWPIKGADGFYITRQGELAQQRMNALIVVNYHSLDGDTLNKVYAAMVAMLAAPLDQPKESS